MPTRHPRRRFDDDVDEPIAHRSTYAAAVRGPAPVPSWVVTDPDAVDDDRGVLKTGKEADVHLVERSLDAGSSCLLAVKRYRTAHHRQFHRDATYLEGRRVKESREMRAIERRTDYGRMLIAEQWAIAEFRALGELWTAGLAVPYPVQLLGNEVSMEFIGSADGVAAPRLAETSATTVRTPIADIWRQVDALLGGMVSLGYTHGDLSPYNLLLDDDRVVAIDLPQLVDLADNPQGHDFLRRDCRNMASWFATRGVHVEPDEWCDQLLAAAPPGFS